MIKLIRTDSTHPDFRALVKLLDAELGKIDGEEHAFYAQYNKIDNLQYVMVAYAEHTPVGCGAIKPYADDTMEVKRMYVTEEARSKGIGSQILNALEIWAKELNYQQCILETGLRQPDAIRLYEKNNYQKIANYGQYKNVANSVCMQKSIN